MDPARPGTVGAGPPSNLEMIVEEISRDVVASVRRRRWRRMRGQRHVPSHSSTEVRDLIPDGEWSTEYIAAQQRADDNSGQVH